MKPNHELNGTVVPLALHHRPLARTFGVVMKTDPTFENTFYVEFYPQKWGQYSRFYHFYQTTHKFDKPTVSAIRGIGGHASKARRLLQLSEKIIPSIAEERKLHEGKGVIPGVRSGEYAALAECVVAELYSVLDCTRKIIGGIYGRFRGVARDSTRRLFQNAQKGGIDLRVPEAIRNALANAHWYNDFRRLRDGITHGETGSCHLDAKTGKITYFHTGLGSETRALVIEDIHAEMHRYLDVVIAFVETVFSELNQHIKDERFFTICGMFRGRIYSRLVSIREAKDFGSGVCNACEWFEREENPTCPAAETCQAYLRIRNTEQRN